MSTFQINVVLEAKASLGEAPYYDHDNNELIWVDIDGKSINFLKLADGNNRSFQFPETVSAAIPCKSGKNIVALIGKKICLVDRVTGNCTIVINVIVIVYFQFYR